MSDQIHNKKELLGYRKELRRSLTPAEALLWRCIQNRKLEGRKFRRQHSVGDYILDFYCPSEKLAIELDGALHFTVDGNMRDEEKTNYCTSINIRILRFENKYVIEQLDLVVEEIKRHFFYRE